MSLTNQANRKRLNGCSVKTILEDTIMKMFKKLMAVALAGVMALAVLTGCGTSVNEKEVIKIFNDTLKTEAAVQALAKKDVKIESVKADSDMKAKAQSVAKILATDVKDETTLKSQRTDKYDEIKKAVAGDDTTNQYLVGYAPKVKYDSKLYNTLDSGIDALTIILNSDTFNNAELNPDYEEIDGAVSLIGFADTTINGTTYTVAVIKIPTQKVNH
jgi:hypothetical protein